MRKLCWFLPLLSLVVFACMERQDVQVAAPETIQRPDVEGIFDGIAIKLFNPDNRYTGSVIGELTKKPVVQLERERFAKIGYTYSPEHSFVTEAVQANGKRLDMTVLSMRNARYAHRDAIHLLCMRTDARFVVVPIRLIFGSEGAPAATGQIADGVRIEAIEPLGTSLGLAVSPMGWSWKKFGACLETGAVAGGVGCAIKCIGSGAGYLHCFALCSGGVVVGSLAGCAFQQLF